MDITIKWQSKDGEWHDYDHQDIMAMSRTHAKNLFSQKIPVVAKQGEIYVVNTVQLRDKYQASGKKTMLFLDMKESAETLEKVGLFDPSST